MHGRRAQNFFTAQSHFVLVDPAKTKIIFVLGPRKFFFTRGAPRPLFLERNFRSHKKSQRSPPKTKLFFLASKNIIIITMQGTKRKRKEKSNKLSPEELERRKAAAKNFMSTVDEGASVLDARKAKPGTNVLAIVLRKFPTRQVTTAKGGKVPSTGFVALVGSFQVDPNVEDVVDPDTGVVTLQGVVDKANNVCKPTTLEPFTVYTFSMFRKLSNVREGSVVKLFAIDARFWTPEDRGREEMIFYGAANIQPAVESTDFRFVNDLLHSMPNALTRWVGDPERPDPAELAQLIEERAVRMNRKRGGGGGGRGRQDQAGGGGGGGGGGGFQKRARRGGKANFFIHVGQLSEEEQDSELCKRDGFFANTQFGTTAASWFWRSQETEQDLGRGAPPLGRSNQDAIKMNVRLVCCQWKEDEGGYDKRAQFTIKAGLFSEMLALFGVQTSKCWDVLKSCVPRMRFLAFMNEDRLETARLEYNDPALRSPGSVEFGKCCFIVFVQRVWGDVVGDYSRVGIPVNFDYMAQKLVRGFDPTAEYNTLDHQPLDGVDSSGLTKNIVCVNEFRGDLKQLDQTSDRLLAIINYVPEARDEEEVEEILKGLTPEEGTRFLKMKESNSRRDLARLKDDFGADHPVVKLDQLLHRVNVHDPDLRCVFFAVPREGATAVKKRLELRAEFLGPFAHRDDDDSDEDDSDEDMEEGAAASAQTPETQEIHPWQSLDDGDDQAMLEAVEQIESRRAATASSIPPLEDEITASQLLDGLDSPFDESEARGVDEEEEEEEEETAPLENRRRKRTVAKAKSSSRRTAVGGTSSKQQQRKKAARSSRRRK